MPVPEIRYARSGDHRLAYQQWGSGPRLMLIPDLISNVEVIWEHELYRRSLEYLGKHMTCVLFDKRGIGMSDRFERAPTLDERNADVCAVMDAVGWDRAHVMGQSEGAAMGLSFAVDHPERVETLTMINTFPPPRYIPRVPEFIRDGDPPILDRNEIYEHFMRILETWGEDATALVEWSMPSQIGNESFTRWVSRLQRFAASPNDFKRQLDNIMEFDAEDAPERVSVPTQVMHVAGDKELHVSLGRLLGDVIPGAKYVEIEGADHFFWTMPNWREIVDGIIRFTGGKVERTTERRFGTVLFTDIVDSTRRSASMGDTAWRDVMDGHDRTARGLIDRHGGRVVESTGDGLLSVFDAPSTCVECGLELRDALRGMGLEIRAGVHAGEVEVRDDGRISGIAVNLAARVEQHAADGEFWASSTVREMLLGGSTRFEDRGEFELKGFEGRWQLFAVAGSQSSGW